MPNKNKIFILILILFILNKELLHINYQEIYAAKQI